MPRIVIGFFIVDICDRINRVKADIRSDLMLRRMTTRRMKTNEFGIIEYLNYLGNPFIDWFVFEDVCDLFRCLLSLLFICTIFFLSPPIYLTR